MKKLEKKDVEKYLVTPIAPKRYADPSAINAGYWDKGEETESSDFYWAQLYKVEAFGFPIDGGTASLLAKTCSPSRVIAVLYFLFTVLELLVKKGLGLSRAILFIRALIDEDKSPEAMRTIVSRFTKYDSGLILYELSKTNLDTFFDRIIRGMRWALEHIQYHPQFYKEMFEKFGGRKMEDEKLAEKCNERMWLRDGWEKEWVEKSRDTISKLFDTPYPCDLLRVLCTKALAALGKPCDYRKTKTEWQMLFAELGCPLNQPGVPRFMDMLRGIVKELEHKQALAASYNPERESFSEPDSFRLFPRNAQ